MIKWGQLSHYWDSGEYQVVQEHLSDLSKRKVMWNPGKNNLFRAMELTPFEKVSVCIIGQDPYPNPEHATGVAFSVPSSVKKLPPTLTNIFEEYSSDLSLPSPTSGDLTPWTSQGVFLWNAIPTCTAFSSMSHVWSEWLLLTEEIVKTLSNDERYKVFVFLGTLARHFTHFVNLDNADVIEASHPSPRGSLSAKSPFKGSRIFSRINDFLCSHAQPPIDWKLP